jgi:hypothetical protein
MWFNAAAELATRAIPKLPKLRAIRGKEAAGAKHMPTIDVIIINMTTRGLHNSI